MKTIKILSLTLLIALFSTSVVWSQDCEAFNGTLWGVPKSSSLYVISPSEQFTAICDSRAKVIRVWNNETLKLVNTVNVYDHFEPGDLLTGLVWSSDRFIALQKKGDKKNMKVIDLQTKEVWGIPAGYSSSNYGDHRYNDGYVYTKKNNYDICEISSYDLSTKQTKKIHSFDRNKTFVSCYKSSFLLIEANSKVLKVFRYGEAQPYGQFPIKKYVPGKGYFGKSSNDVNITRDGNTVFAGGKYYVLNSSGNFVPRSKDEETLWVNNYETNSYLLKREWQSCSFTIDDKKKTTNITRFYLTNKKTNKETHLIADLSDDIETLEKVAESIATKDRNRAQEIRDDIANQELLFQKSATPEALAAFNKKKEQKDKEEAAEQKVKRAKHLQIKQEADQLYAQEDWSKARAIYQTLVDDGNLEKEVFENHAICSYKLNEGEKVWKTIRILTEGRSFTTNRYDYYQARFDYYDNHRDVSKKVSAAGALKEISNISLRRGEKDLAYKQLTIAANYAHNNANDYIKAIIACNELLRMKPEKTEWANALGKANVLYALEVPEDQKATRLWDALSAFERDKNSSTAADSRQQEIQVRAVLKSMGKL